MAYMTMSGKQLSSTHHDATSTLAEGDWTAENVISACRWSALPAKMDDESTPA
jgi:hypothetical protein